VEVNIGSNGVLSQTDEEVNVKNASMKISDIKNGMVALMS
jgi:hypothetical protein